MTSPENTPRLGLVDLPTLIDPLAAAGFRIFGGGPFREAAVEIKTAAEQGPVAAIFVADRPQPGIKAWLTRMAGLGSMVVVLRDDEPRLDIEGARSVDLPASVGELLQAAGLTPSTAAAAAVRIGLDGQVHAPASAAPVPAAAPTTPNPTGVAPAARTGTPAVPVSLSVESSPVLFAAQRRAETPAVEPANPFLQSPPDASPWQDPPAAAAAAPAAPWQSAPAVPAASASPPAAPSPWESSPWDAPVAPAYAPVPEPFAAPAVDRDEDWFGAVSAPATAAPPRTPQPPPYASGRHQPHAAAEPPLRPAEAFSAPHRVDPAPVAAERQPMPYPDDPWGQGGSTPIAVLTQSKHDLPEAAYPTPATDYREAAYEPAPTQPVYDPAPAYVDPQSAVDAMFAAAAPVETAPRPQEPRRIRGQGSPLAFICAEKGGVGKSNTTLALAQRAAELSPGKRVVLVDMNRGQGDIRKYLKLGGAQVPSILDAAISGNFHEAVLSPEQVTSARHSSLPPISFGVVLAPEAEAADPRIVTPEVYQQVIDLCRDQADLVLVDTQIIEIHDTSGLVDGLIVPALAHDAFGVTLTDTSAPGVSNLVSMLGFFAQNGVPRNRLMILINRALAGYDTNVLRGMLTQYGHFAGAIEEKPALAKAANMGRIPHTDPSLSPVLDAALLRVTSWPCFQPAPPATKKKFFARKAKN